MKTKYLLVAVIIEVFGIGLVGVGIGYEAATGADLGYLIITMGSCLVAGGALVWAKFLRR